MSSFFIDRPIFAWVVAILISLFGYIAMRSMGIDSYPNIAPPQVTVTAIYPGASAATMESTVTQVIEQQLTGIDNLLYFSSTSGSNGQTVITLSFATGTNPDTAQVQVQNKVTLATPLLPPQVTQQGVVVAKASPDILMFLALQSNNSSIDAARLSDILASQVQPAVARVSGVGNTTLLGSEYAARIWLESRQAARLRVVDDPGSQCGECAERAVRGGFARRGPGGQGAGVHGHRFRRRVVLLAQAVPRHHPARQQRRYDGAARRCRAHHVRCADVRDIARL